MKEYYKYWGKAKKPESGKDEDPSYHLLVYHCLDVAAVGKVWLKKNRRFCKKSFRCQWAFRSSFSRMVPIFFSFT
jgi:hypothetical protein